MFERNTGFSFIAVKTEIEIEFCSVCGSEIKNNIVLFIYEVKAHISGEFHFFQRCSVKKLFLEISQNSQENTSARVSFLIKLQA